MLSKKIDGIISVKGDSFVSAVNGSTTTPRGIVTYICAYYSLMM